MVVNQPGSRAGLITTLVIFIVLFFAAGIFAMKKHSDWGKEVQKNKILTDQYARVISEDGLSRSANLIQSLSDQHEGQSYFDIREQQVKAMARMLAGRQVEGVPEKDGQGNYTNYAKLSQDTLSKAITEANQQIGKVAGVQLPGPTADEGMVGVVRSFVLAIGNMQSQLAQQDEAIRQRDAALKAKDEAYAAARQEYGADLAKAVGDSTQAKSESQQYHESVAARLKEAEDRVAEATAKHQKAQEELSTQLQESQRQAQATKEQLDKAVAKLKKYQPTKDILDAIVRRPDGKIIQLDKNSIVYINLGTGNQITPGMTFEIYDKAEGVPSMQEGDDKLPTGKGSLEVVRVGANSSECRVVRTQSGNVIVEGDIVANLVYDPNIHYAFHVFGDFDLDQNNVATQPETEVVKRLVAAWGGRIADDIGINTDFVVLGKEPEIPTYTKEELEQDPYGRLKWQTAVEAKQKYDAVRTKAQEFQVPILNQNQFLYLIGYYDQAKR